MKVVIIHGTGGNPDGNWFPWLSAELSKCNVPVIIPRMPTPEGQSLAAWLTTFDTLVGPVDAETVLIGHSVGAVFLLRLLERIEKPVRASFFVAGFIGYLGIEKFDLLNSTFVEGEYDWNLIQSNAGKAVCFSGSDDPYVPIEQGIEIARNLKVAPRIIEGGGHLNAEFGYHTFPLLLEELSGYKD